jgi:hypothetical protein
MKAVLKSVLIATMIALTSCSTGSINEPEQIGKQVFEILKNISTDSKESYISKYISIEEIRALGKNEEVVKDEGKRNFMTSMLKEKWISSIERDYNRIKENSGINWKNIEYLDFVYELKDKEGMKVCEGELYFKFNEKSFKIETSSLWNGKEYKLVEVEHLNLHE